jgi:hypothetical protein
MAQAIAKAAFEASVDKHRSTPYSMGATEAFDMVYSGAWQGGGARGWEGQAWARAGQRRAVHAVFAARAWRRSSVCAAGERCPAAVLECPLLGVHGCAALQAASATTSRSWWPRCSSELEVKAAPRPSSPSSSCRALWPGGVFICQSLYGHASLRVTTRLLSEH